VHQIVHQVLTAKRKPTDPFQDSPFSHLGSILAHDPRTHGPKWGPTRGGEARVVRRQGFAYPGTPFSLRWPLPIFYFFVIVYALSRKSSTGPGRPLTLQEPNECGGHGSRLGDCGARSVAAHAESVAAAKRADLSARRTGDPRGRLSACGSCLGFFCFSIFPRSSALRCLRPLLPLFFRPLTRWGVGVYDGKKGPPRTLSLFLRPSRFATWRCFVSLTCPSSQPNILDK
jgi:hypothetical protein